jgi:hypothetical protein
MMKISVKLVALHFQLSILTGKFKLQNQVSFLYQFINENGFYTTARHFYWLAYFRTGNVDAANGWQYSTEHGRYIAPISTNVPRASWYFGRRGSLVAFRQHCTRLVQRYLQTGDVKKTKPTGRRCS